PIVVLNITVDPSLIDVNIHPTKMDIKFSKLEELNYLIENTIREKLKNLNLVSKVVVKDEKPRVTLNEQLNLDSLSEREIKYDFNPFVKGEKSVLENNISVEDTNEIEDKVVVEQKKVESLKE